ncbi:MAG: FtsQ-type POTRA domain-containing protein [Acidaminococcaceae bacterium]|nr:FtsQ-type POTRA domain-containing protein [Acidaminococcaceae bacterium]
METIRERLRQKRRRKRLRLLLFSLCVFAVVYLCRSAWVYVHEPDFSFGNISIKGTKLLTRADVIRMGGGAEPLNLFNLDIGRIKDGLKQDYRFKKAEIGYGWPAELKIEVQEREAALYVANAYRSYLKLDYSGVVLSVTAAIPDANAPLLVGIGSGNFYLGDRVEERGVLNILDFLHRISPQARASIAEITVDGKNSVSLRLRNSFPIVLGNVNDISQKVALFTTVYEEIKNKKIQAEYIDLTFAKPYIKVREQGKQ